MSDSIVSASEIRAFKAAIQSYSTGSENTLRQFDLQIRPIMRRFEEKLDMLEEIRNEKYRALSSCHERQKYNDDISCSSQEREFAKASGRYHECLGLIREARAAIQQFRLKSEAYRSTTADLVSRAKSGLDRVEDMISKYSSQTDATTTAISEAGPILSSSGMESAIHISGGDRIASVISRSTGKSAVVIDPEAMARKLDNLPPVSDPDSQTMRTAALGIIALLAGGGLAVGSKEMILQQKTDEIFEQQYGISRTEMLLASGHKRNEYVNAYNNIHKGLRKEIIEVQKKEISAKIQECKTFLKDEELRTQQKNATITLSSIELVHQKEVELANLENRLATLTDGKKRPVIPDGNTNIGGLSEKGMAFMMSNMTTKERFITVSNIMYSSDVRYSGEYKNAYVFKKGEEDIFFVARDGSYVDHFVRDTSEGFDTNILSAGVEPNVEYQTSPFKESEIEKNYKPNVSLAQGSYKADGIRLTRKHYSISSDGSARTWGNEVSLGLEAELGLETKLTDLSVEGEASLAKAGIKAGYVTAPCFMNGKIQQFESGGSVGSNAGLAAGIGIFKSKDGTREIGVKFPGGKIAAIFDKHQMPLDVFPETLRNDIKDKLPEKLDLPDSYARAMRPGERPKI